MFWLPFVSAEWAFVAGTFIRPLDNAVEVKVVGALPLDRHAIISGNLAARAGRLERELANRTLLFFGGDVPHPRCHRVPAKNF